MTFNFITHRIVLFWNLEFGEKVKVGGFKCTRYILSIRGTFEKRTQSFCTKNVSLNTILSTDIRVALEQESCLLNRSEYIRLLAIILGLPSE